MQICSFCTEEGKFGPPPSTCHYSGQMSKTQACSLGRRVRDREIHKAPGQACQPATSVDRPHSKGIIDHDESAALGKKRQINTFSFFKNFHLDTW